MGRALPVSHYNEALNSASHYKLQPPAECALFLTWEAVAGEVYEATSVLDLGCGTGQLREVAQGWCALWLGIDWSYRCIQVAQKKDLHRTMFLQYDARDLVVPDDAFDTVVMTDFLEHVNEDIPILKKLPPNQRVVISVPPHDSGTHVRFFPTLKSATDRYGEVVNIDRAYEAGPSWVITGSTKA